MIRRREFIAGLGSAAAWPLTARAQQSATPVIGVLHGGLLGAAPHQMAAFQQGLKESGYTEGRNLEVVYRFAENRYDLLPAMAEDLVRRGVVLIVTMAGTPSALAAKAATNRIPIVFQFGADPVKVGLVASLNRPGANITGVTVQTNLLFAKRLELLRDAVPTVKSVAFLLNPTNPEISRFEELFDAARTLGLDPLPFYCSLPREIEAAFATIAQGPARAIFVDSDAFFFAQGSLLARLAAQVGLPAVYHAREIVELGGLMSYGANFAEAYHIAGVYAGRVLNGEKPAELPVQQSSKIELVLNLKTAKALGLTFPLTLLGRADEVIE
jgi:putative ABC transport system substrate-binding protein